MSAHHATKTALQRGSFSCSQVRLSLGLGEHASLSGRLEWGRGGGERRAGTSALESSRVNSLRGLQLVEGVILPSVTAVPEHMSSAAAARPSSLQSSPGRSERDSAGVVVSTLTQKAASVCGVRLQHAGVSSQRRR
ncbi:hypothetical protein FQA47_013036 [Oryzias melastigma]|uniref:Uncharacterized protein n=1 Tax=Oryzias melastigma TaxID=30732 RepID=A0A834L0W4_ORYME|nr:hypothetical protein FQA47_013036 [Oryzias melastigma]